MNILQMHLTAIPLKKFKYFRDIKCRLRVFILENSNDIAIQKGQYFIKERKICCPFNVFEEHFLNYSSSNEHLLQSVTFNYLEQ
jgi:hypothetical protein